MEEAIDGGGTPLRVYVYKGDKLSKFNEKYNIRIGRITYNVTAAVSLYCCSPADTAA